MSIKRLQTNPMAILPFFFRFVKSEMKKKWNFFKGKRKRGLGPIMEKRMRVHNLFI